MKNILKITFVSAMLALFTGCETTELDLLDNPNAIEVFMARHGLKYFSILYNN